MLQLFLRIILFDVISGIFSVIKVVTSLSGVPYHMIFIGKLISFHGAIRSVILSNECLSLDMSDIFLMNVS